MVCLVSYLHTCLRRVKRETFWTEISVPKEATAATVKFTEQWKLAEARIPLRNSIEEKLLVFRLGPIHLSNWGLLLSTDRHPVSPLILGMLTPKVAVHFHSLLCMRT